MPNIAQMLREEISRLARREVRAACDPLREQMRDLKQIVREHKKIIAQLEKNLEHLQTLSGSPAEKDLKAPEIDNQARLRISPASIKKHRRRLKLSQRELGKLLNVSTNTVVRWEAGTSKPCPAHRVGLAQLRAMGVRQVKKLLSAT